MDVEIPQFYHDLGWRICLDRLREPAILRPLILPVPGICGTTERPLLESAPTFSAHNKLAARSLRVLATRIHDDRMHEPFADIHCHILPGIDDGARNWDDALAMARLAADDGTSTIVATPHQFGVYRQNRGDEIRTLVADLNERLAAERIPVTVLAGGEIRIEPGILDGLVSGELVTLGDHRRHLLLELPHDMFLPLDAVMNELATRRVEVVLAHPERNEGILRQRELAAQLVEAGCLMQITAGSLCGTMGSGVQELAEWMLSEGLVHLVATDGHSPKIRRPLMGRAYERLLELTDLQTADDLCSRNPSRLAAGRSIVAGRRTVPRRRRWSWWSVRKSA